MFQTYRRIRSYLIPIVCFVLGTMWIGLGNLGVYPVEGCIARYFLAFFLGYIVDFVCTKRTVKVVPLLKIICILATLGICAGILTFFLVKVGAFHVFSKRYIVFIFGIAVLLYVVYLYIVKRITVDIALALVVFVVGTIMALSYPAGTGISWDDQDHYHNILEMSHFNDINFTKADKLLIDSAYQDNKYSTITIMQNGETGKFEKLVNDTYEQGKKKTLKSKLADNRKILKIAYLPEAIALFLSRGLGIRYTFVFIIGRWTGVALYSLLLFLSLRQIKSGKLILFLISMLPVTLFLASNYSYDTWGIGLSMLGFSLYIGIMQDQRKVMHLKDIILICMLFILAYVAKPNYFCMVFALLFIENSKLDKRLSKRNYRLIVCGTAVVIAALMVIPFLTAGTGGDDMRGGETVNSASQIQFILNNPIKYSKILLSFLAQYWSMANVSDFVPSLAYLGKASYSGAFVAFVIVIIILDKHPVDVPVSTAKRRLWTLFLAFSASCLFATVMYIAYTPVALGTINGCQGRYMLPLLAFVGYYISDYRIIKKIKDRLTENALVITTIVVASFYVLQSLYNLVLCYY